MASNLAVAILLSLCVVGCTLPAPKMTTATQPTTEYHVYPPDSLAVTIRPEPEINRTLTVRPDGYISLDLIGDLYVRGKTVPQIRGDIEEKLKRYILQPDVTVVLAASSSRLYYVFGEVGRPGSYPLIGDVDALQALATAGGPSHFAALNSSRLVRPSVEERRTFGIRYAEITRDGVPDTNYTLQDGDVIYVPPNTSANIGYALQIIFYPLQQIIGLGGRFIRPYGF